ncbi:MAG: hypothetical protein JWM51_2272 [Microbacteriaceae bacterium]|nr:hypothetical protein [Microbacteriaceae bacterium]
MLAGPLDLDRAPEGGDFREARLITDDATSLVSLGVLRDATSRFPTTSNSRGTTSSTFPPRATTAIP